MSSPTSPDHIKSDDQMASVDPDGGFISPKKGITLSVLGPVVWTSTLIFYQMAATVHKIDYATFCLFVSFGLAALCSLYIFRSLYKNRDLGGRALLWLMTTI